MRVSKTRQIVKEHIQRYYELENAVNTGSADLDAVNEYLETKQVPQKLLVENPYWWLPRTTGKVLQKPQLRGVGLNQYVQAIRAINEMLVEEDEGMEEFI